MAPLAGLGRGRAALISFGAGDRSVIKGTSLLMLVHVAGLVLGVGAATVKAALLLGSRTDAALLAAYLRIVRPVTRFIIGGLVLMTLSGVGWLLTGYPFSPLLVVKIVLVVVVWALGPLIDNVAEPAFRKAAPAPGEAPSEAFLAARGRYVALELAATSIFWIVVVLWVLR